MKKTYHRALRNRKHRIERRLDPKKKLFGGVDPELSDARIRYEMSDRSRAINCGGIGAIHTMTQRLGLASEIDLRLKLLKRHLPYHESDHVLSLAYNALLDGQRLQDIELRRNDEAFLDGLGVRRIPDPTTAGDFTRRFGSADVLDLMEGINATRQKVWKCQPRNFLAHAFIDIDGTIAPTQGECKGGMAMSYKGIWGYCPLLVSLANTSEPLFLVNRPGNVPSHSGCVPWIDRAIALVKPHAAKITLRGDTDFSLTEELDRWEGEGIHFIFGIDAHPKLCRLAEELKPAAWRKLERVPKYVIATEPRSKPENVKEEIVRLKGYQNQVLTGESVAEFEYTPVKCKQPHRVVVLRKNITVKSGDTALIDEIRYFFYITNHRETEYGREEIVGLANSRCDQENVIEQLKNGVNAMRMPVNDLTSNWAYMVMAALAWNLKAWFGLLMPRRAQGLEVTRMEFRRFLHTLILLPAQIVKAGRRIFYRILTYNGWLSDFFSTWERLQRLRVN